MRIDAHNHFWKFNPVRDAWISEHMSVLKNDFSPEDLSTVLQSNQMDGTVAIQADQSIEETSYLLDLALKHDFIKGVVGWIDLQVENIEEQLEKFDGHPRLKGFRHIAQAEEDDFLIGDSFNRGIRALTKAGYTFDILIYPQQFAAAIKMVEQHPDQLFIIDHIAKPLIRDQIYSPWEGLVREISQYSNVYCKVSGLITEANWTQWKADDFRYYLDVVFNAFGIERLLFGSDWPVCLLAGSYPQVLGIINNYCASLSASDRDLIFGQNAIKFYKL